MDVAMVMQRPSEGPDGGALLAQPERMLRELLRQDEGEV
jgi:hypothetical protein